MGQGVGKAFGKNDKVLKDEAKEVLDTWVQDHTLQIESVTKIEELYRLICECFEHLNKTKLGAPRFDIPSKESILNAFEESHESKSDKKLPLKEAEFKEFVHKVVFRVVTKGKIEFVAVMMGLPPAALLIKRAVPGPVGAMSEDLFIPLATSATALIMSFFKKI
ncbi:hypothetical protein AMTRI_Chr13g82930 [Amborella trichopoda]|uniref:Uncharacterized protein n=1 Tax=Amborella trichopoda TaxID=13333 RepID=W1NSY3_AMBTC|nr:uncharacterized protein LOC18428299 [Amborella trichopoda]ERN00252.1 hypothetical protein AMTR_s00111p00137800 [Amborella trichopoda]|eukprot:XP_006837398.1 uncharacterized protein LOC18428299 [Amborella trichopoda]